MPDQTGGQVRLLVTPGADLTPVRRYIDLGLVDVRIVYPIAVLPDQ